MTIKTFTSNARKSIIFLKGLLFALLLLVLNSCHTTQWTADQLNADAEYLYDIPNLSSYVIIEKERTSAENLYWEIRQQLTLKQHPLDMFDDKLMMVTTRGKVIRDNRLEKRMEIRVRDTAFGARAVVRTYHRYLNWGVNNLTTAWYISTWDQLNGRLAFGETTLFAKSLTDVNVSYDRSDPFTFWDNNVPQFRPVE